MPPLPKLLRSASLCLLIAISVAPQALAQDTAQAKSRLEQLGSDLGQALRALRQRLTQRDSLRERLTQADKQVAQINSQLLSTQRQATALEQALASLRAEQAKARAEIERQRRILGRSLALAARNGTSDRLKLLLQQQDPARLARQLRYQRYLADAQTARLTSLREQLDAFEARESRIIADAEVLSASHAQLDQQRRELERLRAERKTLLAQAEQDVSSGEQRVKRLQQDQRELKTLLANIARRQAQQRAAKPAPTPPTSAARKADPKKSQPPGPLVNARPTPSLPGQRFSARRSHLPWPLSGRLTARFGTPRESGRMRWEGVVISAKPGATVRTIHTGKVVYADVLGGYGLLVIVDHGEGYLSLYGQNDAVLKRPGQRVSAGEAIAQVGDRGSASGLYFEIRHQGKPVNPSIWCGS
ncbi:murein hydrolase activator EnvC [Immundisolibacter sp.]|uniref:murein hydrolase activator EnvC family protein n=1 Tax=Immundisolibacter sp. TaxID=1934948 RepID=UPI0035659AD3